MEKEGVASHELATVVDDYLMKITEVVRGMIYFYHADNVCCSAFGWMTSYQDLSEDGKSFPSLPAHYSVSFLLRRRLCFRQGKELFCVESGKHVLAIHQYLPAISKHRESLGRKERAFEDSVICVFLYSIMLQCSSLSDEELSTTAFQFE